MTVRIRPIVMEDFPSVLNWSRDELFCSANGWESNREKEELYQWWKRLVMEIPEDFIRLGLELDGKLIGYVDFADIQNDTAEFGIAIGDSGLWGKGIGYQAALAALDHASTALGITKIFAETHETNLRSRRLLEKIGFKELSRKGNEIYLGENVQLVQLQLRERGNHIEDN